MSTISTTTLNPAENLEFNKEKSSTSPTTTASAVEGFKRYCILNYKVQEQANIYLTWSLFDRIISTLQPKRLFKSSVKNMAENNNFNNKPEKVGPIQESSTMSILMKRYVRNTHVKIPTSK